MGSPTEDGIGPLRSLSWRPERSVGMLSSASSRESAGPAQMSSLSRASSMAGDGSLSRPMSVQMQKAMQRNSAKQDRLGYLNKGVPRPKMGDLELMEVRRRELMEEKARAVRVRQDEEIRKRVVEGVWAERNLREGRLGRVHREGMRRMMAEGNVGG